MCGPVEDLLTASPGSSAEMDLESPGWSIRALERWTGWPGVSTSMWGWRSLASREVVFIPHLLCWYLQFPLPS